MSLDRGTVREILKEQSELFVKANTHDSIISSPLPGKEDVLNRVIYSKYFF